MLLGLSLFNVELQASFFTLLFHPHLILKCNMSPNEVYIVCPTQSHPFISPGVTLGSTLLAIHSNPIIWPPPILSNLPSSSSLPLRELTLCAKVSAKAQSPSSQLHFSCDSEPTLQSFRECVDLQVTSCFHALSCTSPLTGRQGPLLGTQGPPHLLSSLLRWLLDTWVSSQICINPLKLL